MGAYWAKWELLRILRTICIPVTIIGPTDTSLGMALGLPNAETTYSSCRKLRYCHTTFTVADASGSKRAFPSHWVGRRQVELGR